MSSIRVLGILRIQVAIQGGGGSSQDALPIYQASLKLGRSRDNDIILQDPNVSSQHAKLTWGQGGWVVEDLDSRNGTYLRGQRLPPHRPSNLHPGDTVQIDAFAIQVQAADPNEPVPPRLGDGDKVSISTKRQPGLAVFAGGGVLKFPLDRDVMTLGRRSDCDVQLRDPLVSGQHARLERMGDTFRIVDLDSTNGLTYQGRRVAEHILADGDVLQMGGEDLHELRQLLLQGGQHRPRGVGGDH